MEDEISLKDMIDVLVRQRRTVLWFLVFCIVLSLAVSFQIGRASCRERV